MSVRTASSQERDETGREQKTRHLSLRSATALPSIWLSERMK